MVQVVANYPNSDDENPAVTPVRKAEGMGLEPTIPCGAPHFQCEPTADGVSNASITAPSTSDAIANAIDAAGDAPVTVEPSAQGQYGPDDIDAGDIALEQAKSAWPFLLRDLRLAIVAIATLVKQSTMDQDGSDQMALRETDSIPG